MYNKDMFEEIHIYLVYKIGSLIGSYSFDTVLHFVQVFLKQTLRFHQRPRLKTHSKFIAQVLVGMANVRLSTPSEHAVPFTPDPPAVFAKCCCLHYTRKV